MIKVSKPSVIRINIALFGLKMVIVSLNKTIAMAVNWPQNYANQQIWIDTNRKTKDRTFARNYPKRFRLRIQGYKCFGTEFPYLKSVLLP